jgi:tetratricopeptide (TPR) repeat protein
MGRYKVGRVVIAPELFKRPAEAPLDDFVGFTRLVHCRHCGAGGPWRLNGTSRTRLSALLALHSLGEDLGLFVGELRTFDGQRFRYPTESVAHLQELIAKEPERAFLWIRLGNIYAHAERPDLAEEPFRRAIKLEPDNAEAHGCLAGLLQDMGRWADAAPHWKAVLQHARGANQMTRELRLNMVSTALDALLSGATDVGEICELLPRMDLGELAKRPKDEPVILQLRTWDLRKLDDWEEICRLFLGERVRVRRGGPELDEDDGRGSETAAWHEGDRAGQSSVPRNAPCPCGSGRKYKKCCGRE